ncbi:MAG: TolC family protein [Bacteroidia bacterium]|nr:TolC family protein [Bacteroidia bacterium]
MARDFGLKIIFGIAILWIDSSFVYSQADSVTLSYKAYIENIFQYHPIAKTADLRIKEAEAEMLDARGNLDPVISSDWNQKNFDDKLYYRQYQTKFKIPTLLGIDAVGGYENTDGIFLNPENSTDEFGLWHLGIEVNLLQGLYINERRTAMDQARVFQELAKNEQQIILNDLVYNASVAYILWQQYAFAEEVLTENVTIANTYFENTKQAFANGEKTAMDTLEAFILYQDARAVKQKNELGLIKARRNIENFLWFDEIPITLRENTLPENYLSPIFQDFEMFEDSDLSEHPIILSSLNKLSYLDIEQKLKREKLKPKLKIKYNPLLATSSNNISPSYSVSDFKWGFDFSMPLLFRSERASLQKGAIKIQETKFNLETKRNELQNKIENSWQQQGLLEDQLTILSDNVESYKQLLDGENEKFNYGESSVFLLNKRQEKYINGQLKVLETYIKRQIELLNFLYFSNQLIDQFAE